MAISLEKGGEVNLSKDHESLRRMRFALGWDPNPAAKGDDFDLDATAFILRSIGGASPKLISEDYMVFYNNEADPEQAFIHSGDNEDGEADEDDADNPFKEIITGDLDKITAKATEVSFVVTIHKFLERKQNFGMVNNSFIALINDETEEEILRYSLEDAFSSETAVQFGSLYKKDGDWMFKAVGTGYNRGLGDFVVAYGSEVKKK